ncbi:hypothetical protein RN001_014718 [Aquatica leii]|uniref:RING-type domain-containing protein n=1 Tax=Aquatica leii TaxID=1421715 RepID=A0AAN7PNR6_9COLE|nr:hypothetical protein RN001_014718 [Aquatica leii]
MSELIEEADKLSRIVSEWDLEFIVQALNQHAHKDAPERKLLVLEDYFRSTELNVPVEILNKDVDVIKELFPEYSRDYLLNLLQTVGSEKNRLRIITKILINDKRNGAQKRAVCEDIPDNVYSKKIKISNDTDVIEEDNVAQSSSLESNSTIIYLPEEIVCEKTVEIVTPEEIICEKTVEIADSSITNNSHLDQPSTSKFNLEDFISSELEKLAKPTLNPISTNNEIAQDPVLNIPDLTNKKKNGFNIYKHLQEIFPEVSYKVIKSVCKSYSINKYIRPCDAIMNEIVKKLLSHQSGDAKIVDSSNLQMNLNLDWAPIQQAESNLSVPLEISNNEEPIIIEDYASENNMVMETDELDEVEDNSLVYPLMEMFPEACPQYIRNLCRGKKNTNGVLDQLISSLLENEYPKRFKSNSPPRVLDASEQLEIMKNILVDADPDYLQMHCDSLIDKPDKLKEFIEKALEKRNYPTMKDFLRRQQISAQQKQYTTDFSIEKFLEVIPSPFEYFRDREKKLSNFDNESLHYAMRYLRNKFNTLTLRAIRDSFSKNNRNFLSTCYELSQIPLSLRMKSTRQKCLMPEVITNIPLLQEIAFFEHQSEILVYLNEKKLQDQVERAQTKAAGLMKTCFCCFDDEVMPKEVVTCEVGCVFCKSCVQKGVEVVFGEGKLDFACLSDCSSYFSLQALQAVLTPKMFSAIALKKQVQEVKAAGIDDLESCPFCEFVTIPARDDKLFRCLNPECMKESCRQCKEPSHVPLRCDEVENDQEVKTRTYIENKMTEALLRTCYKCGMKFIKEDGCNKMTCSCGALMCYVCGKPVKDYKHFNGLGGDKTELCPLYSDTNQLHREAVLKGAETAKNEIGVTDSQLKINPASDIQDHYKVLPKGPTLGMPPLNPFNQLPQQEILLQRRQLMMLERHLLGVRRGQRGNHHHHHRHQHNRDH